MLVLAISDLALAIVVGAATAVGAGIGGAITGLVTLRVERQRQTLLIHRDLLGRRREAIVAARLVAESLEDVRVVFDRTLESGRWELTRFPTEAWREHRSVLAAWLPAEEWQALTAAVKLIELFAQRTPDPKGPLRDDLRPLLEQGRDAMVTAIVAVASLETAAERIFEPDEPDE